MLGTCMNKYLPCCAPEESRQAIGAVETQCCLWSLPCFAVCPTRCFDECCPADTTADRCLSFSSVALSVCAFIAGCLWLWIPRELGPDGKPADNTGFYQDLVFCLEQTLFSQLAMFGVELVHLNLSVCCGLGVRCLHDFYEDFRHNDHEDVVAVASVSKAATLNNVATNV